MAQIQAIRISTKTAAMPTRQQCAASSTYRLKYSPSFSCAATT
ncbi:MAG: hypothetical protein PUG21_04610 [Prevotella sp.]|nr:hypothetical protein [Prevotella sp.]MDY2703396.1 hypothetical protein [Prevotella sp.]